MGWVLNVCLCVRAVPSIISRSHRCWMVQHRPCTHFSTVIVSTSTLTHGHVRVLCISVLHGATSRVTWHLQCHHEHGTHARSSHGESILPAPRQTIHVLCCTSTSIVHVARTHAIAHVMISSIDSTHLVSYSRFVLFYTVLQDTNLNSSAMSSSTSTSTSASTSTSMSSEQNRSAVHPRPPSRQGHHSSLCSHVTPHSHDIREMLPELLLRDQLPRELDVARDGEILHFPRRDPLQFHH